jgi:hypothetical protein
VEGVTDGIAALKRERKCESKILEKSPEYYEVPIL